MASPPSISFLAPPNLDGYDRSQPPSKQPASVPRIFLDAMAVRELVFVKEQGVPLDNELDEDDPRCCHWVAYDDSGPIGTIRLVPYPQPPHPVPGGVYVTVDGAMKLQSIRSADGTLSSPPTTSAAHPRHESDEPYVKLGRLAVDGRLRGKKIGQLLVQTVLEWIKSHPTYFEKGTPETPFKGLVYIHAQEQAAPFWKKAGFREDESMGRWWEEEMAHVGMFCHLNV